jgi:predicted RNA binding protein YcfA (HicA-like mRNA interferase family)
MPKKIRELKASKAGFFSRPGKGSHTVWEHPALSDTITMAGKDGSDAKPYQEKDVQKILKQLKEVKDE